MNCHRCKSEDAPPRVLNLDGRQVFDGHACTECFILLEREFRKSWAIFQALLSLGFSEASSSKIMVYYVKHNKGILN
jgi:hypothetical protein